MRIAKFIIRLPLSIIGTLVFSIVLACFWLFNSDSAEDVMMDIKKAWKI